MSSITIEINLKTNLSKWVRPFLEDGSCPHIMNLRHEVGRGHVMRRTAPRETPGSGKHPRFVDQNPRAEMGGASEDGHDEGPLAGLRNLSPDCNGVLKR